MRKALPLYEAEELANLIRLGLAVHVLEIEQLRDVAANEDVMAPTRTLQLEAEGLHESPQSGADE
jgi:hypothetical protein